MCRATRLNHRHFARHHQRASLCLRRRCAAGGERTQAVQTRRAGTKASEIGALDGAAIERVRDEVRPDPRDADELHDALLTAGFLLDEEVDLEMCATLVGCGRITRARSSASLPDRTAIWVATERVPELLAIHPAAALEPIVTPPASRAARTWTREEAVVEFLRGRMAMVGPTTADALAVNAGIPQSDVDDAARTGIRGRILRGNHAWCPCARMVRQAPPRAHSSLHAEPAARRDRASEPGRVHAVPLTWQHVEPSSRLAGPEGLRAVLAQLDGLEIPARAWERDVLTARLERYEPSMLDMLCLSGEIGSAHLSSGPSQVVGATPIALFLRQRADDWWALRQASPEVALSDVAQRILDRLQSHGASFAHELNCMRSPATRRRGIGGTSPPASSRQMASPACVRSSVKAATPGRSGYRGRWSIVRGTRRPLAKMRFTLWPGRCSRDTESCSVVCSRANHRVCRGEISRVCIARWRRAARSAAGDRVRNVGRAVRAAGRGRSHA